MSDPYETLGIPRNADETTIRRRYLELIRESTPDRAPERFAEIRAAYEEVREPIRMLNNQLFDPNTDDTMTTIASELRTRLRSSIRTLPVDLLLALADPS
jgi:DnaJ-class molecular chaperone